MNSYYYEVTFSATSTKSQQWNFTDELLEILEKAGFVAGGVQNRSTLELAVDNLGNGDLSPNIEKYIQSGCVKHPCVIKWRRRDEAEMV
jgi:hypothetical protein